VEQLSYLLDGMREINYQSSLSGEQNVAKRGERASNQVNLWLRRRRSSQLVEEQQRARHHLPVHFQTQQSQSVALRPARRMSAR